jgi:methylthioribulose-1-phosphate dehydratase
MARAVSASRYPTLATASRDLASVGRRFYARGWVMGTSGNFSVILGRDPLRLAITPSAAHKGALAAATILQIDERGRVARGRKARPSAETALHVAIARARPAGAILHTHSIWSTMLSEQFAGLGGLAIEGFEMLKGLEGVTTHTHREWLPVVDNDQDIPRMAAGLTALLEDQPGMHAFLIRRHGLYTWGRTLIEAERHVEILEFLFEAIGREGVNHGSRHHS